VTKPAWAVLGVSATAVTLMLAQSSIMPGNRQTSGDYAEVIPFCGVDNFGWTVVNALARSAQPQPPAWQCLREHGFTTIVQQNVETDPAAERALVESTGMQWVGDYGLADQTAYAPEVLGAMLQNVVARMRAGERILVHDSGGRGRIGMWEAAFLLWDGWRGREVMERYVGFGWKINGVSDFGYGYECPGSTPDGDPASAKGSNGQFQAMQALIQARGDAPYDPSPDRYGNRWRDCGWPEYMRGWDYTAVDWPPGHGGAWSLTGVITD
jgi:hypothetical protein